MAIKNKSDISLLDENDSLCRVCLTADENNKCIFTFRMNFERGNCIFPEFWEKLQFYGGIEITRDDGLPTKICSKCISDIHVSHNFRTQCQDTDKQLRFMLKNSTKQGIEIYKEELQPDHLYSKKSITNVVVESLSSSRISQDSVISPVTGKSIDLKKVKDIDVVTQDKVSPSRRLIVTKKACFQKLPTPRKSLTKKSITKEPVDVESSKCIIRNAENLISNVVPVTNENPIPNKGDRRSRRLFVFKRMTSLENLKNHKERQRRHIKKTISAKSNREDCEVSRLNKNKETLVRPSHRKILPYKCTKCWRSYKTKELLQEHELCHDNKKFSCEHCDERFGKLAEFLEHAKSHELSEKLKPATCQICNKNFRKALTMVRHLHVHKRQYPKAVYAILKEIRDKREREKLKSPKNRNLTSDISNIDSNSMNDAELSNSSQVDNALEESEIPSDDSSAIKLINIWIREELDSDNEGKGFPCEQCGKSYVSKKSLEKHTSKMHDCSECEFGIKYCICPDRIHGNRENRGKTKYHRCKVCEKTFDNETNFAKHMSIHASEKEHKDKNFKRFLCHICSKTFRQNNGLMFHMRIHTGYKPHVCKYCGRGFTTNSNCINHERVHTGDRPFVCHFCSAAFAKSCTLKAHITTHTGEANYHCKTCGKSFRRLKYLKEHTFTHTGEKPYVCKICGTAYSHSGSLFVHSRKCKSESHADPRTIIIHSPDLEIEVPMLPTQQRVPNFVTSNTSKMLIDETQMINQANGDIHSNQSIMTSNAIHAMDLFRNSTFYHSGELKRDVTTTKNGEKMN